MYTSTVWYPVLKSDVDVLESVQRQYTKSIRSMCDLTYLKRLDELNTLTVANQRTFADMVLIFKCVQELINCSAADLGIFPIDSITRGSSWRLQ